MVVDLEVDLDLDLEVERSTWKGIPSALGTWPP
jgi:hypothetical protein